MNKIDESLNQVEVYPWHCPTLDDLLNPIEEDEIGRNKFQFLGGDDKIIAKAIRATNEEDTEDEEDEIEEE
jgi:hypothetical protein